MFAIIIVLLLPPRESARSFVKREFLYGICEAPFTSKFITFIKLLNDRFILIPSFSASSDV